MKRNLTLISAIAIATLVSCTKESELDQSIVSALSAQTPIEFTAYASAADTTKGATIDSNTEFQKNDAYGSFDVTALVSECTWELDYGSSPTATTQYIDCTMTPDADKSAEKYFSFSTVEYDSDNWVNLSQMYWPNYSKIMHFAAYSPTSADIKSDYSFTYKTTTNDDDIEEDYSFSFDYTVPSDITKQIDLMYAMTSVDYLAPTNRVNYSGLSYVTSGVGGDLNDEEIVNLHFKHALTQIAFEATKDADLDVYVKSITLCNVYNSGKFTATSLTDDADADADDNPTVGDDTSDNESNDKVNADNFGSWDIDFSGEWINLTTENTEANFSYYTSAGEDGTPGGHTSMSNYAPTLVTLSDKTPTNSIPAIQLDDDAITLTSSDDVLMLIPQTLTAWVPQTSTETNYVGFTKTALTGSTVSEDDIDTAVGADGMYSATSTSTSSQSYLAIDCEIYHKGATSHLAAIHDGFIFVPFETKDIDYDIESVDNPIEEPQSAWLPGYKITYHLNFGGGYVVAEEDGTGIPEPGCIPDTKTYTLRPITYTATVDVWEDLSASSLDLDSNDTSADD